MQYQQVELKPSATSFFGQGLACCDNLLDMVDGDVFIRFKDKHVLVVTGKQCARCYATFVKESDAPNWDDVKNVHFLRYDS